MDRARYLDPLKRKTKEPIYEYFKTKVKEAYKAASDSPGERQLNLIKRSPTFPKGKGTANLSKRSGSLGTYSGYGNRTSSAAYGNVPAKTARQYDTQIGPQKPTSSGTYSGYGNGTSSADYGYKAKSAAPAGGTGPKKKKGATTSAAPAGGTGAKPKRKSHFQRRQAERYAIGSSGKPL